VLLVRYGRRDPRLNNALKHWVSKLRWRPINRIVVKLGPLQLRWSEIGIVVVTAVLSLTVWLVQAGIWHLDQRWGIGHVLMWQAIAVATAFIAVVDSVLQLVPNALLVILAAFAGVALVIQCVQVWVEINDADQLPWNAVGTVLSGKAMGFGLAALAFLAVRVVSRGGLGAGDVKLYALLGACAGFTGVIALILISLFLSAVVGLGLVVFRKRKGKDALPLAPFTFVAVLVALGLGF
jgi:prepilin signal peptidase PulO-like enzyme (type II secretory pathway)